MEPFSWSPAKVRMRLQGKDENAVRAVLAELEAENAVRNAKLDAEIAAEPDSEPEEVEGELVGEEADAAS
jgi:hypothetical protein